MKAKTRWLCQECGEVEIEGDGNTCPKCGNDKVVGAAVEMLRPSDPMNIALGNFQFIFRELHEVLASYLSDHLKVALAEDFVGILDVKLSVAGGKLVMRRNLRRPGAPPPNGRVWSLAVSPEILAELFQRLTPAPPEEPAPPLTEVDASQVPLEDAKPAPLRHIEMLRQRAREVAALQQNIARTIDACAGVDVEEGLLTALRCTPTSIGEAGQFFDALADSFERERLQ